MDYSLWSSAIFDRNVTEIKIIFSKSLEGSLYADHNAA